ncbi:MAG TPA: hypothetical protein VEZ11_05170 [Thermoanaerobaculia bacterium]|nr:hypothetical protein [Thermoanaerobaculia bacterium]
MRKITIIAVGFMTLFALALQAQVAEGDHQYELRAEGHQSGRAKAARIDAAIAAYQKAVSASPNDIEARWKLLRAFRFKGAYVLTTSEEKKALYDRAKKAGEETIAIIDKLLAPKGVSSSKGSEKHVAEAAAAIPGAGEVFFWHSVNWGEWALAFGKLAAARQGAADVIRRDATIAMLIDPKLEGGGPARVLGRLHDQTPRIPFITGWASSKEAVKFLSESLKLDPTNKITKVFLAEAMVANDGDKKPEAIKILKDVVSTPNDPNYEVEQAAAQDDAKVLLKKWGA